MVGVCVGVSVTVMVLVAYVCVVVVTDDAIVGEANGTDETSVTECSIEVTGVVDVGHVPAI